MREMGCAFVDTIKHLMQLLLEYRDVIKEENVDNKMSCTVSLLVSGMQSASLSAIVCLPVCHR